MRNDLLIISGGQTGCDRATLDSAIKYGVPYAGYIPKGRKAEDGRVAVKYTSLKEADSENYSERTYRNILMAEAVVILHQGTIDKGTQLTKTLARIAGKRLLTVNIAKPHSKERVMHFMSIFCRINIAGPRESESPGIYQKTFAFLERIFEEAIEKQ